MGKYDTVVIGSGPNGLAAAITLVRAGRKVLVVERDANVGGGMQSAELTLPGFVHDRCSAVHPLACASPFFRALPLRDFGLEFIVPPMAFAHPFDDGAAALCVGGADGVVGMASVEATARALGVDAAAYAKVMRPIVRDWPNLLPELLKPVGIPRHPWLMMRFGMMGLQGAVNFARRHFKGRDAAALFAGAAAHAILPLEWLGTSAFGLMLTGSAHVVGWPVVKGGSQKLADALAAYFRSLGGEIELGRQIRKIEEVPAKTVLCDISPRQLAEIAGHLLPRGYVRRLQNFKHGPGVFKMDWALSGPIPWRALGCRQAGTVHIGGPIAEVAASEAACWRGEHVQRPFILLAQASLFDPTRAPAGRHTAWAYCHVPNGSTVDMTAAIESQIERFAPCFRDLILARSVLTCAAMQQHNPNLIGGDIAGGSQTAGQVLFRPRRFPSPYSTPRAGLYLCSASTPPGAGVHGMCGFNAAQEALRRG